MKTIVCLSDIHHATISERLKSVICESDYFLFLGDGISKLGDLLFCKNLYAVEGNCDNTGFPKETTIEIEGVKVLLTHGDRYGVKTGLQRLYLRAKELDCSLVFYGHTHQSEIAKEDGITFVNPGALYNPTCGTPSYAYCVITKEKYVVKIVDLS